MKRILLSLMTVALISGVGIAATRAFFSDVETSTGNTFTAGNLDLKVDDNCTYNGQPVAACTWVEKDLTANDLFFNYADVKPGDYGENTISLKAVNNPAWLCAYVQNLANKENGCNEPEAAADTSCGETDPVGVGLGELQDNLYMTIWRDTNCNNVLDGALAGHCVNVGATDCDRPEMVNNQQLCELMLPADCAWVPGTSAETVLVNNIPMDSNNGVWPLYTPGLGGGPLPGDTKICLGVSWNIPGTVGDVIQSDSVTGDVSFYTEQSRNNPNFVCPTTPTPGT